MSDYKRLTKKDKNTGKILLECTNCSHYMPNHSFRCEYNASCIQTAYERLYELEDKIENQTYIENPYLGKYVYCVYKGIYGWTIAKHEIAKVELDKKGIHFTVFDINGFGVRTGYLIKLNEIFGVNAFLEKEAALDKLAELKGE